MVSVAHALSKSDPGATALERLCAGLDTGGRGRIEQALALVTERYGDICLGTGEATLEHALGMAEIAASLNLDVEARLAALCFSLHECMDDATAYLAKNQGEPVARLVGGLYRLNGLRVVTRRSADASAPELREQTETMRKMLLAMVEDIRVVLLRLASRTQTLRHCVKDAGDAARDVARESLDIYAPLANRLGVWQLKWELEDLSFRILEPDTYKHIASMLDERRVAREHFIAEAIARLRRDTAAMGIDAEVYGRPKHIYSIYNKMRSKNVDFEQVYDVRALRVLVDSVEDCYAVLGIVHQMWTPIPSEYDDYILKPKGNNYQSLHTAVIADDGRSLEVQIRTREMHQHAEFGVAAHWRYKEGARGDAGGYDDKIALLRDLLSWRDEVRDAEHWEQKTRDASFDDTIYVITPQGRVIDLPRGATPVDFAYAVHSELGHRCRGAKVDGQLVPLNTRLQSGQTVEVTVAREGGPSRDWLNPQLDFVTTTRAQRKIKQYFSQQALGEVLERGRATIHRELQRLGQTQINIDALATRMRFANADALFAAAGRGEVGPRAVQLGLQDPEARSGDVPPDEVTLGRSKAGAGGDDILVVGVGKLMTSLARCCKPAPPDPVGGFVTKGRGISVHRSDCRDFQRLAARHPERIVPATWGDDVDLHGHCYPVDIIVTAADRRGLLRDVTEVLAREKLSVTAVNSLSSKEMARMRFTVEVGSAEQIQRALTVVGKVEGVVEARRG